MTPTIGELVALFVYDPIDGVFVRKTGRGPARAGTIAGWKDGDGYIVIDVGKGRSPAHRCAWAMMTGGWPVADIDHINGVRDDNRWSNLRHVSRSENLQNQHRAHSDSRSGLLGASFNRNAKRWTAQIAVGGTRRYLGMFDTAVEAHAAYVEAKRSMHPAGML